MTECEEVAAAMTTARADQILEVAFTAQPPLFESFDEVVRYVRGRMPDESATVIDNVAWMMWETQPGSKT